MLAKYHVQFSIPLEHRRLVNDFRTDDPVECEQFVADLLLRGYKIDSISHDGVPLSRAEGPGYFVFALRAMQSLDRRAPVSTRGAARIVTNSSGLCVRTFAPVNAQHSNAKVIRSSTKEVKFLPTQGQ